MTKKNIGLKELRKLLNKVSRNHQLSVYLPFSDVRNPTWDEVRQHATESYGAAIVDVLDALDGDASGLEAAMSEQGRTMISREYVDYLAEALQHAYEQRKGGVDPEDMDERQECEESQK